MSAPVGLPQRGDRVLHVVCPGCGRPAAVRYGRVDAHLRPARKGERFTSAHCEGGGRTPSPESVLAGLDAAVRDAAGTLRAACTAFEVASAEMRRAHGAYLRRLVWAQRVAESVAGPDAFPRPEGAR